jgi:hypothetical protein
MTEAKAHADTTLGEAKSEVSRLQATARREVAELNRQRDSITGHLTQLRNLLGGMTVPDTPPAVGAGEKADDEDVIDGEVVEDAPAAAEKK